jgi:hypothetical protein
MKIACIDDLKNKPTSIVNGLIKAHPHAYVKCNDCVTFLLILISSCRLPAEPNVAKSRFDGSNNVD